MDARSVACILQPASLAPSLEAPRSFPVRASVLRAPWILIADLSTVARVELHDESLVW